MGQPTIICDSIQKTVTEPDQDNILKVKLTSKCRITNSSQNGIQAFKEYLRSTISNKNTSVIGEPEAIRNYHGLNGIKYSTRMVDDEGFFNGHVTLTSNVYLVDDAKLTLLFQNVTTSSKGGGPAGQTKVSDWRLFASYSESPGYYINFETAHSFLWKGMISHFKERLVNSLTQDFQGDLETYKREAVKDF
jgi:hypothetical protein